LTPPTNELVSMSDEAEADRINNVQGVGEVNYLDSDQVREYSLADFDMLGIHGLAKIPDDLDKVDKE
jgi:hypothetical protein